MPIRHLVLLRWTAEASPEERAAAIARLRALPARIPEIRSYVVEPNIGSDLTNFDLAVVGVFDDIASYEIYRDHPLHQAVIRESCFPSSRPGPPFRQTRPRRDDCGGDNR
jgi:hypothetical protein